MYKHACSLVSLLFFGLLVLSSCEDEFQKRFEEQKARDEEEIKSYLTYYNITNYQRQPSGLYYVPQTPGNGKKVSATSIVTADYIGKTISWEQKFESTYDSGQPRDFKLGSGQLIKGMEEGLQLMQEGEKALLLMPSGLAYGRYGNGIVGPNQNLIFEIKVISVR